MLVSIFVLTFAFLFLYFLFLLQYIFVCFKEAGGLCAVCYFWRRMPVYCLLFYFVCRTAECLCTACYFLRRCLFGICFAVSKNGYQVQKFVVLIFYNFVLIFAFICFDICFYCFNLLYF